MRSFSGMFPMRHRDEQANRAEKEAVGAKWRVEEAMREIAALEDRIDKVILVNLALLSLLEEKHGLSEEDLLERVREIDLRDGKLDGKFEPPVAKCPSCGRTMSRRHHCCMYCGGGELEKTILD